MSNPTAAAALLATHLATSPVQATLPAATVVDASHAPAPQTQLAPSTSSASVSGAFAGQQFTAPNLPMSAQKQIYENNIVLSTLQNVERKFNDSKDFDCNGTHSANKVRRCHQEILAQMKQVINIENLALEGNVGDLKTLALAASANTK